MNNSVGLKVLIPVTMSVRVPKKFTIFDEDYDNEKFPAKQKIIKFSYAELKVLLKKEPSPLTSYINRDFEGRDYEICQSVIQAGNVNFAWLKHILAGMDSCDGVKCAHLTESCKSKNFFESYENLRCGHRIDDDERCTGSYCVHYADLAMNEKCKTPVIFLEGYVFKRLIKSLKNDEDEDILGQSRYDTKNCDDFMGVRMKRIGTDAALDYGSDSDDE